MVYIVHIEKCNCHAKAYGIFKMLCNKVGQPLTFTDMY